MISIAQDCLKDIKVEESENFVRFVSKEPLGVLFIISAWNYPYLVLVNVLIPALLAGNSVILKHAPQTFPIGERIQKALKMAGLPDHVFQSVYIDHNIEGSIETVINDPRISYVHFTGSVRTGSLINRMAASRFISTNI
jgi:acyl-CoA reductase-like NAD-dependent aldehyde dehydrogenase